MPSQYSVVDYAAITVANSAGTILGLASISLPTSAKSFVGTLETAPIRARGDGTSPTTSEGVLLNAGDTIVLSESEINNMEFIRTTSTSGVIRGHFYSIEATAFSSGGS
tara:strand:+ start:112 stop:438 length:327 start_codon:yes stop_codon:yes gene_type:complete